MFESLTELLKTMKQLDRDADTSWGGIDVYTVRNGKPVSCRAVRVDRDSATPIDFEEADQTVFDDTEDLPFEWRPVGVANTPDGYYMIVSPYTGPEWGIVTMGAWVADDEEEAGTSDILDKLDTDEEVRADG